MDASVLEDDLMLQAVGILADSMDSLASPTSLALAVPARALRVVVATRSPHAFEMASRSFSLLDPAMRRQIATEAATAAHEAVQLRKAAAEQPAPRRKSQPKQATGLLNAINNRGAAR